jgi:drug/metabolite transporter (DMT)-like permease
MTPSAVLHKANNRARGVVRLQVVLAFLAIYVLWGSTYLSIRILVETVPPLFAAGSRFVIAGALLYCWSRLRHVPAPTRLEWRNLLLLGALMFLAAYGGLFWAEKVLPSGVASVLVSTIPVWTALFEIFIFKREKLNPQLLLAIAGGLAGVIVLGVASSTGRLALFACLAILGAELAWSFGTVLSKSLELPASKVMSAGGQMMSGGALLIAASACLGELHPFPHLSLRAASALIYLIVAGSLIAFTAYTWLLGRMPATKVASYAYVNPVVALAFGYWLGGEPFTLETLIGTVLILASVILLLGSFGRKSA